MTDWDDLRFFLAVAKKGSIRGAAGLLSVNHSTVSRRIDAFEKKLGSRIFERMPSGYFLTATGEEMIRSAERIESEVDAVNRRVAGRDTKLHGLLRVTVFDSLVQKLLMPEFVAFTQAFPAIELELIVSHSMANLTRREADVAIRISNDPPDSLVGRRLVKYATSTYASAEYLATHDLKNNPEAASWIGWDDQTPDPQWVRESDFPAVPVRHKIFHPLSQMEAAKLGLGLTMLPCFLGDTEPALQRVPQASVTPSREIWILTHEDLRQTARVLQFTDFIAKGMQSKKNLLEGRCPR
ncbi:LysR family transcriptional regulator [Maritalea porphyrae]|uniref:LysR family transcriptional regulator n=1 Tax=Maritalea porphyrae TaxID=880732 RepID=A0ABQ5UP58_9HYPH|nr:LysR family transcriptional regulator [Maritalea porphyrae]GLQ16457.1 LysR family transcriptional regulator [Maritalea porphyrae]